MRDPQLIDANEDTRLIPIWSIVAAAVVFVLVEYYFWLVFPQTQHHVPPLGLRIYMNLSWGLAGVALFSDGGVRKQGCAAAGDEFAILDADLLCDAGRDRRGTLLPVTGAAGFECPACATHVQGDFHFCPQCNYQLTASCGNCFRTVRATDQFCTRCGHELERDHMPARLRVLGE